MSYKPIECPVCHAQLRSKYEIRGGDGSIRKWKWLQWCPVCGQCLGGYARRIREAIGGDSE